MIEMLLTSNFNRSEMITTLDISRATFYRWLSDLRVRKILNDFEKANLRRITVEFEKRWQERIKLTPRGPKKELVYSSLPNKPRKEFGNLNRGLKNFRETGCPMNFEEIT